MMMLASIIMMLFVWYAYADKDILGMILYAFTSLWCLGIAIYGEIKDND